MYNQALARQGHEGSSTCLGSECFRPTFLVLTVLSGAAVAASVLLWHRNRHLYARVIQHTRAEKKRRGVQVFPVQDICEEDQRTC